jgi:predicted MFS family arabinose efflux permease
VKAGAGLPGILAAVSCALCMGFGLAPLFIGTFPIFFQPVTSGFVWPASLFPQALLISGAAGALAGPFVGRLIDSRGTRPVLLPGLVVWAAMLASMGFVEHSPVKLYVFSTIMGVAAACCGPVALVKIVSGWFDRGRGVALGLVLSAAPAAGTAAAVLVSNSLIGQFGWERAYLLLAASVIAIPLPFSLLFLRERRDAVSAGSSDGMPPMAEGHTLGQAVRTHSFWITLLSVGLVCGAVNGVVGHLLPWSHQIGIDAAAVTAGLSIFSLAGPFGSLGAGWVADHVRRPNFLAVFFLVPLAGVALLFYVPSAVVPALILMGIGFSAASGLLPYLATRYFGVAYAAEIFGVSVGCSTLMMGSGPVVVGLIVDRTGGNYLPLMLPVVFVVALGFVLSLFLPGYNSLRQPD